MITKEAIEAGLKAAIDKPLEEDDVRAILTAAFAAMPGPAVKSVDDVAKIIAFAGRHKNDRAADADDFWGHTGDETRSVLRNQAAAVVSSLTPAPDLASENERLRAALEKIIRADDTGPMVYEQRGDGPCQAIGGSEGKFAAIARAALERT